MLMWSQKLCQVDELKIIINPVPFWNKFLLNERNVQLLITFVLLLFSISEKYESSVMMKYRVVSYI